MKKPKFSELDYEAKKIVLQEVATRTELSMRFNGNSPYMTSGSYYDYLANLREYIRYTMPLLKLKDYFEYQYITQKDNNKKYIDTNEINKRFNDLIESLVKYGFSRALDKYLESESISCGIFISGIDKSISIFTKDNNSYNIVSEHINAAKERMITELSSFSCVFDFLIKYIEDIDCNVYLARNFQGKKGEK